MPIGYVPLKPEPTSSGRDNSASRTDLDFLVSKFEKMKLVNMAMWTFLKEEKGLTEDDLINRVKEIDKLDGSADGKLRIGIKKCGKCGRTLNPKFEKCQYCGFVTPVGSVFETF